MIEGVVVKFGNHIEVRMPKPNRHANCFAIAFEFIGGNPSLDKVKFRSGGDQQGFYTHEGKFLDRVEAFKHAKECGQIINPDAKHCLFSEDLW